MRPYHQLHNAEATLDAIAEQLRSLIRPYSGAHFTAAFAADRDLRLITARVTFRDQHVASRPAQKYPELHLIEEWVPDQWEAHRKLEQIFSGQGDIEGLKILESFAQTNCRHETEPGLEGWGMWKYDTHVQPTPGWVPLQTEQGAVITYGEEPYLSVSQGVSHYVQANPRWEWANTGIYDLHSVVTLLPDMRAKFITAEWTPATLKIEIEARIPLETIQLQVVHARSRKRAQLITLESPTVELAIPDDTQEVYIFLVHSSGEIIEQLRLAALYETYGFSRSVASDSSKIATDLEGGETENIEYKPFMSPNNEKENEFVDSVIAFANTSGGTVYVGINEKRGTPQGTAEVIRRFKNEVESEGREKCVEAQRLRLRSLISNNIKPIPAFELKADIYRGEPIVIASIKKNETGLCSTHDNKHYVRKGSTNRMPSTEELALLLCRGNNGLLSWNS